MTTIKISESDLLKLDQIVDKYQLQTKNKSDRVTMLHNIIGFIHSERV